MTIKEIISTCDHIKPNQYSDSDKIGWLNDLDGTIKKEIIDTHEGYEDVTFAGYTEDTNQDTALLVGSPYTDVYLYYLFSKIDLNNAEYTRYNNNASLFSSAYDAYAAYYNRQHMPLQNNSITV